MKTINKKLFFAVALFSNVALAAKAPVVTVSLKKVVSNIKSQNFQVLGNAQRVYQAKQRISAARLNLLPRLNLWRVANVAVETAMGSPAAALGIVTDLAPFLVPSNWFAIKNNELLYQAERDGYQALWGNELATAKSIYYQILLDQELLAHVAISTKHLEEIHALVLLREQLGGVPAGTSLEIESRMLGLQEDERSLRTLVQKEQSELAFSLGIPAPKLAQPEKVTLPSPDNLRRLSYEANVTLVMKNSPELKQFENFIAVSARMKKEVAFSILGMSSMAKGTAGGVFDSVPAQDGLGFDLGATIKISRAQTEILRAQRTGVQETLKRQLNLLSDNYNLSLETYDLTKRRLDITRQIYEQFSEKLVLGQDIDMLSLVEASRNLVQAETGFFSIRHRLLQMKDRLARLTWSGDYSVSR